MQMQKQAITVLKMNSFNEIACKANGYFYSGEWKCSVPS